MRIAALLSIGLVLLIATLATLPRLERLTHDTRRPEFNAQLNVSYDAIQRFLMAKGLTSEFVEREAQREVEALDRMAMGPIEHNVSTILRNYWYAARLYKIQPTEGNLKIFGDTHRDVLSVQQEAYSQ